MALRLLNTKEQAQDTVAAVDKRIAANESEIARLAAAKSQLEDDLILADESDPAQLDQIARLETQLRIAVGRRPRLQGERITAEVGEAVADHAKRAAKVAEIHSRLIALEGSAETLAVVAKYQELGRQSQALRNDLTNAIRLLNQPMLPTRIDLDTPGKPNILSNATREIAALNEPIKTITDTVWHPLPEWMR